MASMIIHRSLIISGDFRTIEFWINSDFPIDGSSSPNIPVNFSNPYEYVGFNNISCIQSGETISIVSDNGSSNPLSSCDAIISGGWHHIAFVANGSNYDKIYIDGVAANMLVTNASLQGFNELNLGKRVNNGPFIEAPYNGFIDEFRIWNFAKSQSQISPQMNTELTGNESGLLVYYKFDEDMSPCDVEDCTSAENHSSNFGSTYSSTVAPISDVICGAPINCGVVTIPNCIQLINPFDGETGVLVDADIIWGNLVFQSINLTDCWDGDFDGNRGEVGVYTYVIELVEDSNCDVNALSFKEVGTITLID